MFLFLSDLSMSTTNPYDVLENYESTNIKKRKLETLNRILEKERVADKERKNSNESIMEDLYFTTAVSEFYKPKLIGENENIKQTTTFRLKNYCANRSADIHITIPTNDAKSS